MGCGGSKDKLNGAEKPLDHWMEPLDMKSIDENFKRASGVISTIEEKRRAIVDDLDNVYESTGTIAFKTRDLGKALKCVVWKLAVDNDGKVAEIGFNADNHTFGGAKNSSVGNEAGNGLIEYCKNLVEIWKPEDLTTILGEIEAIVKDLTSNMDSYAKEIQEKSTSNPFDGLKKISKLKNNIVKCTAAVECLKDLFNRLKTLAQSAPQVLAALNPAAMLNEAAHVEKAHKLKLKDAVQISWNVIEPAERHGKTWNECVKEAEEKTKKRYEFFSKYAKQQQVHAPAQAAAQEHAQEPAKEQ